MVSVSFSHCWDFVFLEQCGSLWGHVYLSCCVCLLSHWPPLALTVFPHPLPVGAPALAEGFGADIQLRAQCFKTLSLYFAVLWVTEGGNLSDVVE